MALIAMLRSTNSGARFSADTETAGADWRARRRAALPRLRGPPVAELQRGLNYGYNEFAGHLETDGVYGPPTEAALRLGILPRGQLRRVADNEPG